MLQPYNPANADLIVNINGKLVHRDEAGVSPFDSSVQNGDAVWEGLRLYQGRIFKLTEHLDRLRRSASLLNYHQADEVFCTGTMGEIASVTRIDNTLFNQGQPGPIPSRLSELYFQVTATQGTQIF